MNKLKTEKSPYLLQHANNPVEWFPWEEESFEKARKEDKPIFLSIGYSTCHWCHVMAHESFEDQEVADLMNEIFISIKVDREERPDIDKVYMNVCQMMTGSGGWPLTIIMTPNKKPFFAGTYFPKNSRFGRIGLLDLLKRIKVLWTDQRDKITESANNITISIQNINQDSSGDKLDKSVLKETFDQLSKRFDKKNGGFGEQPKFPMPHNLLFLLRFWKRTGDKNALEMVEKTLQSMRKGGIYDHIGYGFHRYSTDEIWKLAHFEKMTYDQALISMVYSEVYQATKKLEYSNTIQEIFTYVLNNMTSNEGAFYSAEDADSEGIEGKYYTWSLKEIEDNFNEEDTLFIKRVFNMKDNGNFLEESTKKQIRVNVLYMNKSLDSMANELHISKEKFNIKYNKIRNKLLSLRKQRIAPNKDDKILTDWNGLMIAALAKGGNILNEHNYIKAAEKAVIFILNNMLNLEDKLLHRYRNGEAKINAFLDDYAFLIWGLIELYEATFKTHYLETAIKLNQIMINNYWDDKFGGFFFTANDSEILIMLQKSAYDGAIPSGNSVALLNLIKLYYITGDNKLEEKANLLIKTFSVRINKNPFAYTFFMIALDFIIGPSYSIVISGDKGAKDTDFMLKAIREEYLPNKSIIFRPMNNGIPEIDNFSNYIEWFNNLNNKSTAYVCINKTCKPPTNDINQMLEYIQAK